MKCPGVHCPSCKEGAAIAVIAGSAVAVIAAGVIIAHLMVLVAMGVILAACGIASVILAYVLAAFSMSCRRCVQRPRPRAVPVRSSASVAGLQPKRSVTVPERLAIENSVRILGIELREPAVQESAGGLS